MVSAKQDAISLIKSLPDDTTLEDIQYHLYVREKVLSAIDEFKRDGKAYTQEEVQQQVQQWLTSYGLQRQ